MAIKISTALANAMLVGHDANGGVLGRLPSLFDEAKAAFESGDRWQLWDVLYHCALFQVTVPDWAVDALIDVNAQLKSGRCKGLNEAIGVPPVSQQQRRRLEIQRTHAAEVIRVAYKMRDEDGITLNSESRELIAKEVGISGKDVQAILRAHSGAGIKNKARGKKEGYAFGQIDLDLTMLRRRGRPLIEDRPTQAEATERERKQVKNRS